MVVPTSQLFELSPQPPAKKVGDVFFFWRHTLVLLDLGRSISDFGFFSSSRAISGGILSFCISLSINFGLLSSDGTGNCVWCVGKAARWMRKWQARAARTGCLLDPSLDPSAVYWTIIGLARTFVIVVTASQRGQVGCQDAKGIPAFNVQRI